MHPFSVVHSKHQDSAIYASTARAALPEDRCLHDHNSKAAVGDLVPLHSHKALSNR